MLVTNHHRVALIVIEISNYYILPFSFCPEMIHSSSERKITGVKMHLWDLYLLNHRYTLLEHHFLVSPMTRFIGKKCSYLRLVQDVFIHGTDVKLLARSFAIFLSAESSRFLFLISYVWYRPLTFRSTGSAPGKQPEHPFRVGMQNSSYSIH